MWISNIKYKANDFVHILPKIKLNSIHCKITQNSMVFTLMKKERKMEIEKRYNFLQISCIFGKELL